MKWVMRTHVGNIRSTNQDTALISGCLYGVADGMGGHQAGDIASRMTMDLIRDTLRAKAPDSDALRDAVVSVNSAVFARQSEDPALAGMGTTLTVLWEDESTVLLAHVGDSRAYLLRDGELRQVTDDHSLVAEMRRQGLLTEQEAATHPYRHMITRAIGTDRDVEPDILSIDKQAGDIWLICSDGLTGHVGDEDIGRFLKEKPMNDAADGLLAAALDRGGRDNITLIILEVAA